MKKLLLTILLLLNFISVLYAYDNPGMVIQKIYSYDGLADNKVLCITQDTYGRMWIGTTKGVTCYDGKSSTTYTKKGVAGRRLSNNNAQAILSRDNGDVWIATSDSLNIYSYSQDRIAAIGSEEGLQYTDITSLDSGAGGVVWIGTYNDGIVKYDPKTGTYTDVNIDCAQQSPVYIKALCEDASKYLWIGTRHDGLFRLNTKTNKCKKVSTLLPNENVCSIYQDNSGNIWIGTEGNLYYAQGDFIKEVRHPKIKRQMISSITEDNDGKIWIGGEEALMKFAPDELFKEPLEAIVTTIEEGTNIYNISYKSIHDLFCDRFNNVWVGTYGGGLNLIKKLNDTFGVLYPVIARKSSLSANKTLDISEDLQGVLWFGMDGSGLVRYNPADNTRQVFTSSSATTGLNDNQILAVECAANGDVWLGGYRGGLACKPHNSSSFIRFDRNITGHSIRDIYQDSDGCIWIGSGNNGLLSLADKSANLMRHLADFKKNLDVRSIAQEPDGSLWLATYGDGVIHYYPNKKYKVYTIKDGLKSNVVYDILFDSGILWVATEDGLSLIDCKENCIVSCEQYDMTISDNRVMAIERGNNGILWLSTSEGLISIAEGKCQRFKINKELQLGEYSEGCALRTSRGEVFFGSFNGVNIVHPQGKSATSHSGIMFTNLSIFDKVVIPSQLKQDSPLREHINKQRKFKLKSSQNIFSVGFVSPDYNADIQYSYMLKGVDQRWNHLGTQNSVTFRNLPAGEYVLAVKAEKPNEVATLDELTFVIMPPIWLSVWAKIAYLIIGAGLLYMVWYFLAMRIKLSHDIEFEQAERLKEEEINDAKLTFFTSLSHELRTPLTLLIAPLGELQENETNTEKLKNIKMIRMNANRLLALVNQILDFRKHEKGKMRLCVDKVNIFNYVDNMIHSFEEFALEKNISLILTKDGENNDVWVDVAILDKICLNLLSNSFKFTPANGRIEIGVKLTESNLIITVTDNGIGIHAQYHEKIFQRFFQENRDDALGMKQGTGIGLHLVKSFVELHHGYISLESTPLVFTSFTVTIPTDKENYSEAELAVDPCEAQLLLQPIVETSDNGCVQNDLAPAPVLQRPIVMIAEDNDSIRNYLVETLARNYTIISCANGREVLDLCAQSTYPNLIICDIMMPVLDGLETCKSIKSNFDTNHIPVILLTAKSTVEDMIYGLECGADVYISKPFNMNHLLVQIKKLLQNREMLKLKYQKQLYLNPQQSDEEISTEEKFLQMLTDVIVKHISEPELNGDFISNKLNISRTSLYRKLKAILDISSGDYIRNVRLAEASKQLAQTDKTVSEVCFDVGFNNPSYFTTCFSSQYGVSPKQYRINEKNRRK